MHWGLNSAWSCSPGCEQSNKGENQAGLPAGPFLCERMYKAFPWWYTVADVHKLSGVMHMSKGNRLLLLLPLCAILAAAVAQSLRSDAVSSPGSLSESAWSEAEPILVIDPGHGGEDGGAVAPNGTTESRINLEIAQRVDALCGLLGVKSILLREEDVSLADESTSTLREKKRSDLKNRAALVNQFTNVRLLSIHQNFFESTKPHGAQVFYRSEEDSLAWAEALQQSLREHLDPENTRTAVIVPDFVYLMRHVSCSAVLVECGFLSNPGEEAKLESPEYQKKLSAVLAHSCLSADSDSKR